MLMMILMLLMVLIVRAQRMGNSYGCNSADAVLGYGYSWYWWVLVLVGVSIGIGIGIGIDWSWYWFVLVLVGIGICIGIGIGIGIGFQAHILQMSLLSQDQCSVESTKESLSYSCSTFPREQRGKVFLGTRNDE